MWKGKKEKKIIIIKTEPKNNLRTITAPGHRFRSWHRPLYGRPRGRTRSLAHRPSRFATQQRNSARTKNEEKTQNMRSSCWLDLKINT